MSSQDDEKIEITDRFLFFDPIALVCPKDDSGKKYAKLWIDKKYLSLFGFFQEMMKTEEVIETRCIPLDDKEEDVDMVFSRLKFDDQIYTNYDLPSSRNFNKIFHFLLKWDFLKPQVLHLNYSNVTELKIEHKLQMSFVEKFYKPRMFKTSPLYVFSKYKSPLIVEMICRLENFVKINVEDDKERTILVDPNFSRHYSIFTQEFPFKGKTEEDISRFLSLNMVSNNHLIFTCGHEEDEKLFYSFSPCLQYRSVLFGSSIEFIFKPRYVQE